MPGNAFSSFPVFKNFLGEHAPGPPNKRWAKAHRMGPPDPQPSTFHKTPATEKLIYNPVSSQTSAPSKLPIVMSNMSLWFFLVQAVSLSNKSNFRQCMITSMSLSLIEV